MYMFHVVRYKSGSLFFNCDYYLLLLLLSCFSNCVCIDNYTNISCEGLQIFYFFNFIAFYGKKKLHFIFETVEDGHFIEFISANILSF